MKQVMKVVNSRHSKKEKKNFAKFEFSADEDWSGKTQFDTNARYFFYKCCCYFINYVM